MPASINRTELLAVTHKEFEKLTALLANVDEANAKHPFEIGASIKDVIGHRAHWTGMFFNWYAQGQEVGVADMSWDQVRVMLEDSHGRLLAFITGMSDADLYGGPMKGGGNKWTTGRWAEASGASHYRSAAKYVRACFRARDASGGGI